jgi:short-subunit dehydrogenase
MDIAVVTGASSALGEAIASKLIQLGFRVYGLGGDYSKCRLNNSDFKQISCDLWDLEAVERIAKEILEKEGRVHVLVNNAKYFGRNAFLAMDLREIDRVMKINLTCPLVLTRVLGESLCKSQGYILQLGATNVENARGGPVGIAASGGLKWMGEALFNELREYGVKVTQISPEPNRVRSNAASKMAESRREAVIDPNAVAEMVEQILSSKHGNIVTEVIMRPQRINELEMEAVKRLPYPEPQPVPYTVPREMIEAEDQLEEEEYQKAQEEKRAKRNPRRSKGQSSYDELPSREEMSRHMDEENKLHADPSRSSKPEEKVDSVSEDTPKRGPSKRRGNRRRGKGKPREQEDSKEPANSAAKEPSRPADAKAKPANTQKKGPQNKPQHVAEDPKPESVTEKPNRRRKPRRKPKPPLAQVGFLSHPEVGNAKPKQPSPKPQRKERQSSAAEKGNKPDQDEKKPAAKKTGKPAPKKSAKKVVKKVAQKVNEPATKKTAAKKAVKKAAKKAVKKTTKKTS